MDILPLLTTPSNLTVDDWDMAPSDRFLPWLFQIPERLDSVYLERPLRVNLASLVFCSYRLRTRRLEIDEAYLV